MQRRIQEREEDLVESEVLLAMIIAISKLKCSCRALGFLLSTPRAITFLLKR